MQFYGEVEARNREIYDSCVALYKKYGESFPREKEEIDRMFSGKIEGKVEEALREMAKSSSEASSTRALSGKALNATKDYMPELVRLQA